jgi:hypothetical protein
MVMGVNMFAVIGSTFMLNFAGRKTLMAIWTAGCAVCLFIQGVAAKEKSGTLELVMTMLFVCCFEFAPGPIVWLYMGEICNDIGSSFASFMNWTFVLIISLFTPTLFASSLGNAGTFILFGACNCFGVVFILLFMKETKDLSDEQVKNLYRRDKISVVSKGLSDGLSPTDDM